MSVGAFAFYTLGDCGTSSLACSGQVAGDGLYRRPHGD